MTPYELSVYVQGQQQGQVRAMQDAVTVVFQGECFAREKTLSGKSLQKVLKRFSQAEPTHTKPQAEKDLWMMIRAINAGLGGAVKEGRA